MPLPELNIVFDAVDRSLAGWNWSMGRDKQGVIARCSMAEREYASWADTFDAAFVGLLQKISLAAGSIPRDSVSLPIATAVAAMPNGIAELGSTHTGQ